jgi:hypothetical protein
MFRSHHLLAGHRFRIIFLNTIIMAPHHKEHHYASAEHDTQSDQRADPHHHVALLLPAFGFVGSQRGCGVDGRHFVRLDLHDLVDFPGLQRTPGAGGGGCGSCGSVYGSVYGNYDLVRALADFSNGQQLRVVEERGYRDLQLNLIQIGQLRFTATQPTNVTYVGK